MSTASAAPDDPRDPVYLAATPTLDWGHEAVARFGAEAVTGAGDPVARAVALYGAVRDRIRYDPYSPFHRPEHYRASAVLAAGRGYCVQKAALLAALARGQGIPSRLSFATVKNHLATRQLLDHLGSDLFVFHGVTELWLEGRWVKATPAFNRELCERHRVPPLEFDGRTDSVFQPFNLENRRFMEYVEFLGVFVDVPVDRLVAAWGEAYGRDRVRGWIEELDRGGSPRPREFAREEVVTA